MEGEINIKDSSDELHLQGVTEHEITFVRTKGEANLVIECYVNNEPSGFEAELIADTLIEASRRGINLIEEVEKSLLEKVTKYLVEQGKN